jgi:transcriptional regulator with XRE-family HTH domain
MTERDDLQVSVAKWSKEDPDFSLLVKAFQQNEHLLDELVRCRESQHLTQREVAVRMGTSQSAVDRVESGDVDPRLSTVQRLAVALGGIVEMRIVRTAESANVVGGSCITEAGITSWLPFSPDIDTTAVPDQPASKAGRK